jgi:siroheme synthase-like protein
MTARDHRGKASYPLFLRLQGLPVLVVGGGPVARGKAEALSLASALVRVVAPEILPELMTLAESYDLRPFVPEDVNGAWLIIAAGPPDVNRAVKAAADARQVFVVAVDDVASCSAFGAAEIHRGGLTVAISSNGRAPALVALLRRALEDLLGDDVTGWLDVAERARAAWKAEGVPLAQRRSLLLQALQTMHTRDNPS